MGSDYNQLIKLQGEKCHRIDYIKEPKQIVDKAI